MASQFSASISALTTRRAVVGASLLLLAAACSRHSTRALVADEREPSPDPAFLAMSQVLLGDRDLSALTAARLADAFAMLAPDVHAQLPGLSRALHSDLSPDQAIAAADAVGLKAIALVIVAAWYTGTAGSGPKAITVSYRDALMHRPVADALAPPTYALGGPAWWTESPPDVGLSRPAEAAPAPATVGTPEPKKS